MVQEARSHQDYAAALRSRVVGNGTAEHELRVLALDGEIDAAPAPYSVLIEQIRDDSFRVTDAQVQAVRAAAGSEKAAFELILASAIGAGLDRWDAAVNSMREADDAAG
jgi:hypothetical protein